jgi:hypothetical protein
MGIWKDLARGVTEFVMEDTYESHRHEVPVKVQYVTDRALILIRQGDLTPKKMAKLADWDVDTLRWIARDRGAPLPGMPGEIKEMNRVAKTAVGLAVDREVQGASRKDPQKKGKSQQA